MYKSVCIVTNYRTASTSFTLIKADEYGLPYKGELFSHERPYRIGAVPRLGELKHIPRQEKIEMTKEELIIDEIKNGTECCFKLMPLQIENELNTEQLLKSVDKIYYLYRRDFKSQCLSWIAARALGDWGKTGFKVKTSIKDLFERQKELHLGTVGKKDSPVIRNITLEKLSHYDPEKKRVKMLIKDLMENYIEMSKLYRKFPGELVCTEDYFSGNKYNPYNRVTTFDVEIDVPDFNVEQLFVDNK